VRRHRRQTVIADDLAQIQSGSTPDDRHASGIVPRQLLEKLQAEARRPEGGRGANARRGEYPESIDG
jgi:hypothetical protein